VSAEHEFIVAEISKSWPEAEGGLRGSTVSKLFEQVLLENLQRGYVLHSWRLAVTVVPPPGHILPPLDCRGQELVETILAVFRRAHAAPRTSWARCPNCDHPYPLPTVGPCPVCKLPRPTD